MKKIKSMEKPKTLPEVLMKFLKVSPSKFFGEVDFVSLDKVIRTSLTIDYIAERKESPSKLREYDLTPEEHRKLHNLRGELTRNEDVRKRYQELKKEYQELKILEKT